MLRVASLSPDGVYRYTLGRQWAKPPEGRQLRTVSWLMLNPSTADGETDDNTIRKVVKYSRLWGFDALLVVNLFAYRSPDPSDLASAKSCGVDIVGPQNDTAIVHAVTHSEGVICAWGTQTIAVPRVAAVVKYLARIPLPKMCLGVTMNGSPRHPLYMKDKQYARPWSVPA